MKHVQIKIIVLFLCLFSTSIYSHFLWLNVDNYNPDVGEQISISIRFGHKFPEGDEARANNLDSLYIIAPDGKTIPLKIKSKGEKGVEPVKVKLKTKGTYLVVLTKKSGFVCKTTKGYFNKSKKQLESEGHSVLWSAWSEGSAKAIINVASPSGKFFMTEIDQRYQVIPMADPGTLRNNDNLPLKIDFRKKPEGKKHAFLYGTYEGFSEEEDTFCFAAKPDKNNIAKLKILQKGVWLVYAPNKMPYKKPADAEEYSFCSTLTFKIK